MFTMYIAQRSEPSGWVLQALSETSVFRVVFCFGGISPSHDWLIQGSVLVGQEHTDDHILLKGNGIMLGEAFRAKLC